MDGGNQTNQTLASGRLMVVLDGHMVVDSTWPALAEAGSPFAFPLVLGQHDAVGGTSIQVRMPFAHSMRVISHFNTYYFHVVYRVFSRGEAFEGDHGPLVKDPPDVLAKLRHAGAADPKRQSARSRS